MKWTFNVRADTQIRDYCGSASYCHEQFSNLWDTARAHGSAVGWHVHYFDREGRQDTSESCIEENIRLGAEALGFPDIVHRGWTFQSEFSVQCLAQVGVRIDYSPLPRISFGGNRGVDAYDWSSFAYRPTIWHGVRMIPAYTFRHALLRRRFRFLNLHTGWLPEYRGVKAEFWTLAAADYSNVGWTLHSMTPRLDDGDIVLRKGVAYDGLESRRVPIPLI